MVCALERMARIWDLQQQAYRIAREFLHLTILQHITMFKRQPLTAVSSARPRCPVSIRVQSVRSRSDLNWANRQRGQEKGSNTMRTLNCLPSTTTTMANSIQQQIPLPNTLPHHTTNLPPVAHGNSAPPKSQRKSAC
jgi:hypothetical protein